MNIIAEAKQEIEGSRKAGMTADLEQLLQNLNRSGKKHAEAVRQVRQLAPDDLLELTRRENRSFQSRQQSGAWFVIGALLLVVCSVAVLSDRLPAPTGMYLFGLTSLGLAIWLTVYLPLRARRTLRKVIAEVDDPRFVGPILMMLLPDTIAGSTSEFTGPGNSLRRDMVEALKRTLPRLRADHKVVLNKGQMQVLLQILEWPLHDRELTRAILLGLKQIGDESAIPVVQRVIRQTGRVPRLQEEAQDCILYLTQRYYQKQQAQTLLRASDSGEQIAPEALLRPATAVIQEGPDKLLRPVKL